MRHFTKILLVSFLWGSLLCEKFITPIHAQDLKDELDALDDTPADDLGDDESSSSSDSSSDETAASEEEELEELEEEAPEEKNNTQKEENLEEEDLEEDLEDLDDKAAEKEEKKEEKKEEALEDDLEEDLGEEQKKEEPKDDLEEDVDDLEDLEEAPQAPAPKISAPAPLKKQVELSGQEIEVIGLDFRQLTDRVRTILSFSSAEYDWKKDQRIDRKQVIISIKNSVLKKSLLKRALDTGEFEGPVALVQAFNSSVDSQSAVKLLIQLRKMVEPTIFKSGSQLFVDFPISSENNLIKGSSQTKPEIPTTFFSVNEQMKFNGKRISLNLKEARISDALEILSQASGKNFILVGSSGDTKVNLSVKNTPWDQILSIILLNAQLGYQKIGETFRIMPIADLKNEINQASESSQKLLDIQPLDTRLLTLNYARAEDVVTNVKDFMTTRGKISTDKRSNTLVVTDTTDAIARIQQYIYSIDKQTPQVLIEGRIVTATEEVGENLGISWNSVKSGNGANITMGNIQSSQADDVEGLGGLVEYNFGTLGSFGAVAATLRMLRSDGKVKVVASPRIVVLNNVAASISQGKQTLVQFFTADGPRVQTVEGTIKLDVTPQIAPDGNVLLKIDLQQNTLGTPTGSSIPVDVQQAKTELLVESGKTVVVGGVYTSDQNESETSWPFLGKLPLLGNLLFRESKISLESKRELLMFISPKILNPEKMLSTFAEDKRPANHKEAKASTPAPTQSNEDDDLGDLEDM